MVRGRWDQDDSMLANVEGRRGLRRKVRRVHKLRHAMHKWEITFFAFFNENHVTKFSKILRTHWTFSQLESTLSALFLAFPISIDRAPYFWGELVHTLFPHEHSTRWSLKPNLNGVRAPSGWFTASHGYHRLIADLSSTSNYSRRCCLSSFDCRVGQVAACSSPLSTTTS